MNFVKLKLNYALSFKCQISDGHSSALSGKELVQYLPNFQCNVLLASLCAEQKHLAGNFKLFFFVAILRTINCCQIKSPTQKCTVRQSIILPSLSILSYFEQFLLFSEEFKRVFHQLSKKFQRVKKIIIIPQIRLRDRYFFFAGAVTL